jgi:hypothetical protein
MVSKYVKQKASECINRINAKVKQGNTGIALVSSCLVTVEPVYNDIGLCDTSCIVSDILWYQLIPHCFQ